MSDGNFSGEMQPETAPEPRGRILAITPTGGRPQAFAQCEEYMRRQTVKPDQWVIVDDCEPVTPICISPRNGCVLITYPLWKPGDPSTQHRNILAALDHLQPLEDDVIIFWEDDDWYHPEWIELVSGILRGGLDLVGEAPSFYYHVRRRAYKRFDNTGHASLCATACTGRVVALLREILQCGEWIDMTLWRRFRGRSLLFNRTRPMVIGMKGMPGRPGVSDIHRREPRGFIADDSCASLRNWIGEDVDFYRQFSAEHEPQAEPQIPTTTRYRSFVGLGSQIRYRCPHCAADHYDPNWIDGHIANDHKETLQPSIQLFDADDKPINRKIYVP